jgi:hypothetical protein
MDFVMFRTDILMYNTSAEIGLLCGFCFNVRQLNIVQYSTRPLYASAASAGLSNQHTADELR